MTPWAPSESKIKILPSSCFKLSLYKITECAATQRCCQTEDSLATCGCGSGERAGNLRLQLRHAWLSLTEVWACRHPSRLYWWLLRGNQDWYLFLIFHSCPLMVFWMLPIRLLKITKVPSWFMIRCQTQWEKIIET